MASNFEDWKKEEQQFEIPLDQPSFEHFEKCKDKIERQDLCRNTNHHIRLDTPQLPNVFMLIKCGRPYQQVIKCWKDIDEGSE